MEKCLSLFDLIISTHKERYNFEIDQNTHKLSYGNSTKVKLPFNAKYITAALRSRLIFNILALLYLGKTLLSDQWSRIVPKDNVKTLICEFLQFSKQF